MEKNSPIYKELKELNSLLADYINQPVYKVPVGYFEEFSDEMLKLALKSSKKFSKEGELLGIPAELSTNMPFSVPAGYFDSLPGLMLDKVLNKEKSLSASEELNELSPLLNGISRQMPYAVPQGYFENIQPNKNKPAKVIAFQSTRKNFMRYAAAAIVIGFISISGFFYFNQPTKIDPLTNPEAWVKKNTNKISVDELESFIELSNIETAALEPSVKNPVKSAEIKELMKDVPDKEIQKFLNETAGFEDGDDLLLN